MSTRTTVTLDDDVIQRVKEQSRSHGKSFRETLNDLLRTGLNSRETPPTRRHFRVKPFHSGYVPGLNYDCTEALLEYLEGVDHR
jgi:plasmid stability protein